MTTEAPSWADQWGAGGIGAIHEDDSTTATKDAGNKKKTASGFKKAKSFVTAGAQKLKSGGSMSFKWVKNKYQKKPSST